MQTEEDKRLHADSERREDWRRWGPYLSDRQWGTLREAGPDGGDGWDAFPHDHARSRAYRWGEDGLLGFTDRQCRLCFALALWNGEDAILKERLFGLTNTEGNHGEDVKELYFHEDATPTASYCRASYVYPQCAYPYRRLVEENARRSQQEREFELADADVFHENRFWDVAVEYAKASPEDILIRITVHNRGPDPAILHLLPTLWFRNTWAWNCGHEGCTIDRPRLHGTAPGRIDGQHETLGSFAFVYGKDAEGLWPEAWFTENETNRQRFGGEAPHPAKDAFHEALVKGRREALSPKAEGSKVALVYRLEVPAGESGCVQLRLRVGGKKVGPAQGKAVDALFALRQKEANAFYDKRLAGVSQGSDRLIARRSWAGLLWTRSFYHYIPSEDRKSEVPGLPKLGNADLGRHAGWEHLHARDILSVPDKWEYPWFAAWDLAFHMVPLAAVDPEDAKRQLVLLLREWYLHPNGQLPAYEYAFGDVNPPVHAWAVLRVYRDEAARGRPDRLFLERCFQKLLINFTWWVNRKDSLGRNLFGGGFLGLDNIGVFDRSRPLPPGWTLEQADGTAWMAFFCLRMMDIAIELTMDPDGLRPAYGDMASKFFEHFIQISEAAHAGHGLWNDEDGFYYDHLRQPDGEDQILRVRSLVGLLPLLAVSRIPTEILDALPGFRQRFFWFMENRKTLAKNIAFTRTTCPNCPEAWLLALPSRERLECLLSRMLDEAEFLSPQGIRSLSKAHEAAPFVLDFGGQNLRVGYEPGESGSRMFGGNSNWRGPVWFPINVLLIEALRAYDVAYGDTLCFQGAATGGEAWSLSQVADEITRRLLTVFDASHRPPTHPEHILFHEYFHGESGEGLGASHQCGWTALAATCLIPEPTAHAGRT